MVKPAERGTGESSETPGPIPSGLHGTVHEVAHKAADRAVDAVQDQLSPDTDRIKLRETAHGHAQDAATEAIAGSLFDSTPNADDDNPYGTPGKPVSRNSAIYRGFWMTIGVALALAVVLAVNEAASVLLLILVSAFLAVGLNPIVEFLIRRNVKRSWAVLVVAALMLGIIALVITVFVGVLRDQITSFIDDAPHLLQDLKRHKTIAHLDDKYHIISDLQEKLEDPNLAQKTFGGIYNVGLGVFRALASTLIVLVLTLYFLASLPQLKRALFSLAPASRRERVNQLGDEILRRVGRYVIGAFLVALLAGTVTTLFLVSVGLSQYALALALAVALLDLIPLVGAITGAAIVCVVCLADSLAVGVAALIFYLIYETLEGYVIYPRVMRSSVDVPEYVTIVAVLLGGAVAGIVGALLALPMAAAILLIGREVWVRRQDTA
jgi:predicted PurR-regulated permease PerM